MTIRDLTTWAEGATVTPDLDPTFGEISSSRRATLEAVARRWMMPRGSLWYDEDAGTDVRAYTQARVTDARLKVLAIQLANEARKDERVDDAEVSASLDADGTLTVAGRIIEADGGSFTFTLAIESVTATLLMGDVSV